MQAYHYNAMQSAYSWQQFKSFSIKQRLEHLPALVRFWRQRSRTRQQLQALQDWQLEDLGISRDQAIEESAKMFWQD